MSDAWVMPEAVEDQRLENRLSPNVKVTYEQLRDLGVYVHKLDSETMLQVKEGETQCAVDRIMAAMEYKNRDEVCCSPDKLPNYDDKLKMFFTEHIHEDEEIRLIKDGLGYFDVRNEKDQWVRIECKAGDLIVLPAGIYHRFTMAESNFTHAIRLFKEAPKWTPVNRPCDENEYRQSYLKNFINNSEPKETVAGPADDAALNFFQAHPDQFDNTVRRILKTQLREGEGDILIMYFTGTPNPVTGKSWCPDCVDADPILKEMVTTARSTFADKRVALLQCTVDRNSYFRHPESYLYKVHPFVQLPSIPTTLVVRTKGQSANEAADKPNEGDDEGGIEVVAKMENPNLDWIAKLQGASPKL